MNGKPFFMFLFVAGCLGCNAVNDESTQEEDNLYASVQVAGAMRNVMQKGELEGIIQLDTLANREGLYGLGPESFLTGELLISDGQAYVSRVTSDTTMIVEKAFDVSAPFFVYAHVKEWRQTDLPDSIKTIKDLERFLDEKTRDQKRPFAFRLEGQVDKATIHVQNLPKGTTVSSPEEAHQGQTNYQLKREEVEIVGFFSTNHQGVFTHHDSYLHLHLISKDETKMGHLDSVEFYKMNLFLPKR